MKMKRGKAEIMRQSVKNDLRAAGITKVLVGFSGGADSTTLLHLLHSIGVTVKAVHCNFHLRGEESMRDEMFAREFCNERSIPLEVIDFDVEGYIASKGVGTSVEMACRELRYAEFDRLLNDCGFQRIAVAHNLDDNVETLMLNLFRGSGVAGLKSMLFDTGKILRPLLKFSRADIEQYIAEEGLEYVCDSTNLQSDYRRNFLRNDVIKLIEKRWGGVKKAISKSIENLQEEQRVLNWCKDYWLGEDSFLSMRKIGEAPDSGWLIYQFASRYGASRDICKEIADVYQKKGGSQLVVGKSWDCGSGKLIFRMKGLEYIPSER